MLRRVKKVDKARKSQEPRINKLHQERVIVLPEARPKKLLELKIKKPKVDRIKRKVQLLTKLVHNNLRAKIAVLVISPVNPQGHKNKRTLLVNRVIAQIQDRRSKQMLLKMKIPKILVSQRQKKELRNKILNLQLVLMQQKIVMIQKLKILLVNKMTLKKLKKSLTWVTVPMPRMALNKKKESHNVKKHVVFVKLVPHYL